MINVAARGVRTNKQTDRQTDRWTYANFNIDVCDDLTFQTEVGLQKCSLVDVDFKKHLV